SLTPDGPSLRAALARRPAAVVAGSLYGFPLDWDGLRDACDDADALLIEDSAQGLGSGWKGRPGGSLGDLTVLSFGRGKGWSAGGGGALLARGRGTARLDRIDRMDRALAAPARAAGPRAAV